MNRETIVMSSGPGFFGLLTIAFIVLKLVGTISWPWIWVLAPIWGPIALIIAIVALIFSVGLVFGIFSAIFY